MIYQNGAIFSDLEKPRYLSRRWVSQTRYNTWQLQRNKTYTHTLLNGVDDLQWHLILTNKMVRRRMRFRSHWWQCSEFIANVQWPPYYIGLQSPGLPRLGRYGGSRLQAASKTDVHELPNSKRCWWSVGTTTLQKPTDNAVVAVEGTRKSWRQTR